MSCNKPVEDNESGDVGESSEGVECTRLNPCAAPIVGRETSDLQDTTRSEIVLNVGNISEEANPSLSKCLQIGEVMDTDSVSEEDQREQILLQISQNFT